jgi:hypothetical protein
MPAFEDIEAAEYDEPLEVLLEWLDTPNILAEAAVGSELPNLRVAMEKPPSHRHADAPYSTPSGLSNMMPQHDLADLRDEHDPGQESSFCDLMAHAQYISSLHHQLINTTMDPSDQARYIESLAAALLEYSIPEVWEDAKNMGKRNAGPLLGIMQDVRPVHDRGPLC